MSQKILEYIHFLLAKFIKETGIRTCYIMTEVWRREIGCKMTKEEKVRNKENRAYKKEHKTNRAYDKNGKLIGLVGRKHVNVRVVNKLFEDQLKRPLKAGEHDQADALGLAACYCLRRLKNE